MEKVSVRVATVADKELYKNLFNMYQNELGLYFGEYQDVDENGYFDNHSTEIFFSGDKSLMPLIITYDERIVGFIVVAAPPYVAEGCDFCIQEMFVVGYYRGKNIALSAIKALFELIKGKYCAAPPTANSRAVGFFRKAFNVGDFEECALDDNFTLFTTTV